jgi:hypothetical protein
MRTSAAQFLLPHGFRTNTANDCGNVHDCRIQEAEKEIAAAGLICADSFSRRRALPIRIC